jgi:hypothetical protein
MPCMNALGHVKEDLSLGPVQSAFRYAEGSYISVFESQKSQKISHILGGFFPKLRGLLPIDGIINHDKHADLLNNY